MAKEILEYWIFSKKELNLIADLMVQVLLAKPDGTEISTLQLFQEVMQAVFVEGRSVEGYRVAGYKISNILLPDNRPVSSLIKWNFENGIWAVHYQGDILDEMLRRKAIRHGYVIDSSKNAGLKLGRSYGLSVCYRLKNNLLSLFGRMPEEERHINAQERYYVSKWYDDCQQELQLWRIPVGCTTGEVGVLGRVFCYIIKGKCHFKSTDKWEKQLDLKSNQVVCLKRKNLDEMKCFQITNIGKADVLVFFVDRQIGGVNN
ncbi:MAG: hypothetical protein IKR71_08850 [Bacteroidales bacterium]|nr:hypothetical protein [Bacteroidales bacterium]